MAGQVILCTAWPVGGEPGVLDVTLDQAAPLQQSAYALSDLLHQRLQLCTRWCRHMAEDRLITCRQIHTIERQPLLGVAVLAVPCVI